MYFPLCCEGKEQMRRKYSCSRALLPPVQPEHLRGEDLRRKRFRKRVWEVGEGRGEERRGKLQMGKKSSICMHRCYSKICLAGARANSLKL